MSEFPGNSHISKVRPPVAADPAKPVEKAQAEQANTPKDGEDSEKKIVTGAVTKRKKPLGKRFTEMFVTGDDSFAQHIVKNVVIPTANELLITVVTQVGDNFRMMVEQALTGKVRSHNGARPNTGGPIAYNRMSAATGSAIVGRATSAATSFRPVTRHSNQVEDIILQDRNDGDNILLHLDALIERQGHCTVGDYYGLLGETPNNTDELWGWTTQHNLAAARVVAVRGGYLINFPRPVAIPPA